jgi:RNA polymerase sigma-70 factor, ECF subfamily
MTTTDSFAALLERFHSDEDAAARDVFQRYAHQLIALTRRQVEPRLAHRIDPEDVVQSAFKSFFLRHREGKLRVGDWDNLWHLLILITRRKCADRVEYLRAERRNVDREISAPDGADDPWKLAADREPLPQEVAILAEAVEHLFSLARRRATGAGIEFARLHGSRDCRATGQGAADRSPFPRTDSQAPHPVARGELKHPADGTRRPSLDTSRQQRK